LITEHHEEDRSSWIDLNGEKFILLFLKKLSDEWWAEYRNAVERLERERVDGVG